MSANLGSGAALDGESFSSTYDCSGKSDAIIQTVTNIAGRGCCGPNGQSICAASNSPNKGNATVSDNLESSATFTTPTAIVVWGVVLALWLD